MDKGKSKFQVLMVTEQLVAYVNNILPNFPKKEIVLKQNIEKNQYELIECLFAYNINTNKRIKDKYIKDFLVKLAMYNYYIEISFHRKYINAHKLKCIGRMMGEIRRLTYGILKGLQNALRENA